MVARLQRIMNHLIKVYAKNYYKDYILIGEDHLKICKSLNSEDFKNNKNINTTNGLCDECEKGYFLNKGV